MAAFVLQYFVSKEINEELKKVNSLSPGIEKKYFLPPDKASWAWYYYTIVDREICL